MAKCYRPTMYQIAVIEDDEEVNNMFATMLRDILPGCDVRQFFDFGTASNAIWDHASTFDLVVSDVDLGPGTDRFGGLKIARALDTKKIPLLIVSGAPEFEFQRGMFRAMDAWDYLQKPVAAADFETQVRRAMAFRDTLKGEPLGGAKKESEIRFPSVPDLIINRRARTPVTWKGTKVHMSMSSIDIVEELANKADTAVSFVVLFEYLASGKNKENLRVKISGIREAFREVDTDFDCIAPVPMTGYLWRSSKC